MRLAGDWGFSSGDRDLGVGDFCNDEGGTGEEVLEASEGFQFGLITENCFILHQMISLDYWNMMVSSAIRDSSEQYIINHKIMTKCLYFGMHKKGM